MTTEFQGQVEYPDSFEPRCACMLLLDTSGSMGGDPIRELNDGIRLFAEEIKKDPLTRLRLEVAVTTFGPVNLTQSFIAADEFTAPQLSANGGTPMGEAINRALDEVEKRKQYYLSHNLEYYRPWTILMTDGAPTDSWKASADRITQLENGKNLIFFAIGVENADMNILNQISVKREALKLKGLSFAEFFLWLSNSLNRVSQSIPGDSVPLESPRGWAEV